ncbi:MAG: phosphatase PAP2 family protein [Lachnospiraceae bacterium]|nr:phosphatase PAP2 family protein [Lachnospiraceae bacterium]
MKRIEAFRFGKRIVEVTDMVLTDVAAGFYIYIILMLYLLKRYKVLLPTVLVPAVSLMAVSLFRRLVNAKRPYEVYGFTPLIPKETQGKSFPSRHVFSIFVIGTTLFFVSPSHAVAIWVMGILLAIVRVISGLHFPRDVIAGAGIGIVCGLMTRIFL